MLTYRYECDGCGQIVTTQENRYPSLWSQLAVRVEAELVGGMTTFSPQCFVTDVCHDCRRRLMDTIRPKSWPRHEDAA